MWMLKAAATFLFLLQFVHFHMCTEGVWFKLWQPAYFLLNLSYIHKRSQKGLRQQNKPIIQVPSSHVSTLHCVVFVNKNGKISIRTEWRIRYVVPSLWTTLKHRLNQNHHVFRSLTGFKSAFLFFLMTSRSRIYWFEKEVWLQVTGWDNSLADYRGGDWSFFRLLSLVVFVSDCHKNK